ncbi:mechanosensitive ion channel [Pedobacter sp. HMF7647]|uniref:Mechanosensitive ion channel n=1 Tax=Hufsiella arboris TaxID=2695275 RepID=A0A7K1Y984_9SPHI|nr:mechanosensitive ion channel domain-containing protein [Hufsiella arboris]MXV51163.1 mechanosensitive ion channel [Hufsiella arboris]
MEVDKYAIELKALTVAYLPKFLLAVVLLAVGWWIIERVSKITSRNLTRIDISLRTFLISLFTIILKVVLVISVAGMVGIQTTSFVALLAAGGLAIGLALQGTLANFAGGTLILILKPYRVGDVIDAQGKAGVVKEIQIFNTILLTPKGETVILPNGLVSNGIIVNNTLEGRSLVEVQAELAGDTDIENLRSLALPVIATDPLVLPDTASVNLLALKPGAVSVAFRAYTLPGDNIAYYGKLIEQIKTLLAQNHIGGPVPHTYVHQVAS